MQIPPYLKRGDSVAIVSTARKITKDEVQPALALLKSWGLNPILGKTIGAESNQFAGDDALRAKDFQEMLDNTEVKAIWCARGGYGTVRMIDALDFSNFLKHPKWIVGYSDITVFHNHIHTLGVVTLHAQMCLEIENKTEATRETLRKALFGEPYSIEYALPVASRTSATLQRSGEAQGPLVGGNLSMLYSLCGSPSALNTQGKILFLEDLDEHLYHVDRMMQNLKRNGMLKELAGLMVGGMSDMKDHTQAHGFATDRPFGKTAEEIIYDTVKEYSYPVCFNFPAGHIKDNRALVMGRMSNLKIDEKRVSLN
ncbi:LD-carboxypeptidase [Aureisphaera sp. CAU 1614]|uniref:LD-carboxypeptidase n=1 Tax=Halomarinibacterium sedimenti TaxID=2857106 RepID=A0A9X1FPY9_9FLAO|nr:LD-carboxypeptidase [Halomarinibacterium sedimenti]MBW2938481.1 LD-carboxypeptidase [Halomarinibacterium sedimenti]